MGYGFPMAPAPSLPKLQPLVDVVFRRLFQDMRLLASLLNALLHRRGRARILTLRLIEGRLPGPRAKDKEPIVDLRAQTVAGEQFHIEVQLRSFIAYAERMLFYWAGAYRAQLRRGARYRQLQPVVSVHFLAFPLLPDEERFAHFHHVFELLERRTHHRLTDHLELHTLELHKFRLQPSQQRDAESKWCYYLIHGHELDPQAVEALKMPEIKEADEKLRELSGDRRLRVAYERRLKAEMDARSFLRDHFEEGKAQGEAIGIKKGKAIGLKEGAASALLGFAIKTCKSLKIPLTKKREAELAKMDLPQLEAFLLKLQQTGTWPAGHA